MYVKYRNTSIATRQKMEKGSAEKVGYGKGRFTPIPMGFVGGI